MSKGFKNYNQGLYTTGLFTESINKFPRKFANAATVLTRIVK